MTSEAQKAACAKYDKAHTRGVYLKLNTTKDADIFDKLGSVENRQRYIKELIRNDIYLRGNKMIKINSNSLRDTNFSVADVLDSYASKISQSDDIASGRLSVAEYVTIISALRYAVSYLRGDGNNVSK